MHSDFSLDYNDRAGLRGYVQFNKYTHTHKKKSKKKRPSTEKAIDEAFNPSSFPNDIFFSPKPTNTQTKQRFDNFFP